VSIGTTRPPSLSHIIININQINYLLHWLLITLRWGRPVPFTLQLGLQAGLTLEQYSNGFDTPTNTHPLGHIHRAVHIFDSLHYTEELDLHMFTCVHMHVHSTDLICHCQTHENHLEFLVNSADQRRLIHHLHFCSHDDGPNILGFHTFTLCSATCTSNSTNHLSHWIII
jgi:hypothetical protein